MTNIPSDGSSEKEIKASVISAIFQIRTLRFRGN